MTVVNVPLSEIAALADCIEAVDMKKVGRYRRRITDPPPIKLRRKNRHGYYVIDDGNHRTMAALLDGSTHIKADISGSPFQLSWRWPRVAPVLMTRDLLTVVGVLAEINEA